MTKKKRVENKPLEDIFKKKDNDPDRRIRRSLFRGICPECNGYLRYRPSFNPENWLNSLISGLTIKVCICKNCKAKKYLIYYNK
jgi:uncharacterized protein with PIN domain